MALVWTGGALTLSKLQPGGFADGDFFPWEKTDLVERLQAELA